MDGGLRTSSPGIYGHELRRSLLGRAGGGAGNDPRKRTVEVYSIFIQKKNIFMHVQPSLKGAKS